MSHLANIGLPISNEEELVQYIDIFSRNGTRIDLADGYAYIVWRDPCGAEVWIQVNEKNELIGFTPHFNGTSIMHAGITNLIRHEGATVLDTSFYAWSEPPVDNPDTGTYPFVFDSPNAALKTPEIMPFRAEIQLSAFAHDLEIYKDSKEYDEKKGRAYQLAAESFIPSGLLGPDDESEDVSQPEAQAIISGTILETEARTNPLTNVPFHWARIKTYGGEVDIVSEAGLVPIKLQKGYILSGNFWLCGKIKKVFSLKAVN